MYKPNIAIKKLALVFTFFLLVFLYADESDFKKRMQTSFYQLDSDSIAVFVVDALNGKGVAGARIEIEDVGAIFTDKQGKTMLKPISDGHYKLKISKDNYITNQSRIEIQAGSVFGNSNVFALSPVMPLESMRIVLEWGKAPADLDLHLIKNDAQHISYRHKRMLSDKSIRLDRDSRYGYGPETITICKIDKNADYQIYVHNYSRKEDKNRDTFMQSSARVTVYANNRLEKQYTVPRGTGAMWLVMNIEKGRIRDIGRIVR
ncbi:hypothetical protein M0P98_08505 [bacterium]|nr:hypothetical protein [bacterium]